MGSSYITGPPHNTFAAFKPHNTRAAFESLNTLSKYIQNSDLLKLYILSSNFLSPTHSEFWFPYIRSSRLLSSIQSEFWVPYIRSPRPSAFHTSRVPDSPTQEFRVPSFLCSEFGVPYIPSSEFHTFWVTAFQPTSTLESHILGPHLNLTAINHHLILTLQHNTVHQPHPSLILYNTLARSTHWSYSSLTSPEVSHLFHHCHSAWSRFLIHSRCLF